MTTSPPVATAIRKSFPHLLLGANFLSMSAVTALEKSLELGLNATWTDRPGIRSDRVAPTVPERITPLLRAHPEHVFFGSVAFKYQALDTDPAQAALHAFGHGMVPTTSGEATGVAADLSKIESMHKALSAAHPHAPLALASGLTPENLQDFRPFISHALVSTGISSTFYDFDETRLKSFIAAAKETLSA